MRRIVWNGLTLAALLLAAAPATAQPRGEYGYSYGQYLGLTERQGGTLRHYDAWGTYEGRSQRSAGGQVLRHYDADGRYLGREDINRDFRRRRPGEPAWGPNDQPANQGTGVQIYLDPGALQPPPEMRPEFPSNRGTPWFNDRGRR
ncbi:hypothetical protein ACFOD4_07990 [Pseudoroseomonas globiformis]|uniref:Type IV secretion protein Rhs n=2 Tax=Teichococcus globiformis TaxID=2307229 RepID=A0ABV7FX96_9PROT